MTFRPTWNFCSAGEEVLAKLAVRRPRFEGLYLYLSIFIFIYIYIYIYILYILYHIYLSLSLYIYICVCVCVCVCVCACVCEIEKDCLFFININIPSWLLLILGNHKIKRKKHILLNVTVFSFF